MAAAVSLTRPRNGIQPGSPASSPRPPGPPVFSNPKAHQASASLPRSGPAGTAAGSRTPRPWPAAGSSRGANNRDAAAALAIAPGAGGCPWTSSRAPNVNPTARYSSAARMNQQLRRGTSPLLHSCPGVDHEDHAGQPLQDGRQRHQPPQGAAGHSAWIGSAMARHQPEVQQDERRHGLALATAGFFLE